MLNSRRGNESRQLMLTITSDGRIYMGKMESGALAAFVGRGPAPAPYLNLLMRMWIAASGGH